MRCRADIQRTNAKRYFCSARMFLVRIAAISRQTWRKAERGEASFVGVLNPRNRFRSRYGSF